MTTDSNENWAGFLLVVKADLEAKGRYARTALADAGSSKIKFLVDFGADIGTRDNQGWRTRHHAVIADLYLHVTHLLQEGADNRIRTSCGSTVLHIAIRQYSRFILRV